MDQIVYKFINLIENNKSINTKEEMIKIVKFLKDKEIYL